MIPTCHPWPRGCCPACGLKVGLIKSLFFSHECRLPPEQGEVWALYKPDDSPWETKKDITVRVLDVKPGWVRFAFGAEGDVMFQDERMEIGRFVNLYSYYDMRGDS